MDKFKEGRMTILKLIRLFDEDGKKELKSDLKNSYNCDPDEAMDISDIISQLSSLKSDHEDWFEEYPIVDLIDLNQISSLLLYSPDSTTINEEVNSEEEDVKDGLEVTYEDNSSSLEELENNYQALSDQILKLSDLEENSSNLLNLPSQLDEKMVEIVKENEQMKKKLKEEDQTRVDEMKAEFKDQIEQQEQDHQIRVNEMKTEFNEKIQDLDEKDLQREESYNQMRNQHENELQDFRDILGDMDHKVQRLNKRIFHLNLEIKSLRSLVSSYHGPPNVSLKEVRSQIEEEMDSINFRSLNREQRVRMVEIQDQLEDEEEELSLQDLQFMLAELQEMNQPTNEN